MTLGTPLVALLLSALHERSPLLIRRSASASVDMRTPIREPEEAERRAVVDPFRIEPEASEVSGRLLHQSGSRSTN